MESPKIASAGSIADLKKFFSTLENPVSTAEFMEMWKDMSDEEKEDFKAQVTAL